MTKEALEKAKIEAGLRHAIDHHELKAYYQPKIDAQTETLVGMEALVRWEHPELGLVSPDQFIPVAEESHLIIDVDDFMMEQAMRDVKAWYDAGYSPGILSLNLSIRQLMNEHFIHDLMAMIRTIHFKVEWLEFEVTESQIMYNPEQSIHVLEILNTFGIKIAIDDFGTGYSSLAKLKRLPVTTLKIDRSFISALPDDDEDQAISQAIISLGQSLNLDIIAEGVETEAQVQYLLESGCRYFQGYYYAKPLPKAEMTQFITTYLP